MKRLRIGLLGLGQVGSGVYSILRLKRAELARKCGTRFEIAKIAVKNTSKKRKIKVNDLILNTNYQFRVQACKKSNCSAYTKWKRFGTSG